MPFFRSFTRRLAFRLWSLRAHADLTRPSASTIQGLDLVIQPGVLHPSHFASSRLLAQYLSRLEVAGQAALDLGTGSGLLALVLARAGARVTAVDINPEAVSCAQTNVARNGLTGHVQVVNSDVFSHVPAESRFDLIVTNPPFFAREPESPGDRAFAAGAGNRFFVELAGGLGARLTEAGRLLMVLSSDADSRPVEALLRAEGFGVRSLQERRVWFETLTIREFARYLT